MQGKPNPEFYIVDNTTKKVERKYPKMKKSGQLFPFGSLWLPSNHHLLQKSEEQILDKMRSNKRLEDVDIGSGDFMHTLVLNPDSTKEAIVIMHGLAGCIGLWLLNLDILADSGRPIYVVDLPGFGRSSRPSFKRSSQAVEEKFVSWIELWRKNLRIEKFDLVGHSMGGFIATAYTIKHPDRVSHLILADPWGFCEGPSSKCNNPFPVSESADKESVFKVALCDLFKQVNPLAILRYFGPFGPTLAKYFCPKSLKEKLRGTMEEADKLLSNYAYHCNVQKPNGGVAFQAMMDCFYWAKSPMLDHIRRLPVDISINFIWGKDSFINSAAGKMIAKERKLVRNWFLDNTDHHVYTNQDFNNIVLQVRQESTCSRCL